MRIRHARHDKLVFWRQQNLNSNWHNNHSEELYFLKANTDGDLDERNKLYTFIIVNRGE